MPTSNGLRERKLPIRLKRKIFEIMQLGIKSRFDDSQLFVSTHQVDSAKSTHSKSSNAEKICQLDVDELLAAFIWNICLLHVIICLLYSLTQHNLKLLTDRQFCANIKNISVEHKFIKIMLSSIIEEWKAISLVM